MELKLFTEFHYFLTYLLYTYFYTYFTQCICSSVFGAVPSEVCISNNMTWGTVTLTYNWVGDSSAIADQFHVPIWYVTFLVLIAFMNETLWLQAIMRRFLLLMLHKML